jgi:acetate kinase
VRGALALAEAFPGLPQVACFDSSFHRTMPEVAQIYAHPKDVLGAGAPHWGYHGISYDYIVSGLQTPPSKALASGGLSDVV